MVSLLLLLLSVLTGIQHDPLLSVQAQARADAAEWYHDLSAYEQSCGVGEVLAFNAYDADSAILAWFYSPPHRVVVFEQPWDRMGAGYHEGFVVVAFAKDC